MIGWMHTLGSIAALFFGAWNIVALKGSPGHKRRGEIYTASMVLAMILSFFLYHFNIPLVGGEKPGPHVFGLFRAFSAAALFFTLLGYYAASRQPRDFWAYTHPLSMTLS